MWIVWNSTVSGTAHDVHCSERIAVEENDYVRVSVEHRRVPAVAGPARASVSAAVRNVCERYSDGPGRQKSERVKCHTRRKCVCFWRKEKGGGGVKMNIKRSGCTLLVHVQRSMYPINCYETHIHLIWFIGQFFSFVSSSSSSSTARLFLLLLNHPLDSFRPYT